MKRALILALPAVLACGGPGERSSLEWLPLTPGARWIYVREQNPSDTLTEEVSEEPVMTGQEGVLWVSTRNDRLVKTYRKWVVLDGQVELPIRQSFERDFLVEQVTYQPPLLELGRELLLPGNALTQSFVETESDGAGRIIRQRHLSFTWLCGSADEELRVPAGVFRTLRVARQEDDGDLRTVWYAQGIGKVKEQTPDGDVFLLRELALP